MNDLAKLFYGTLQTRKLKNLYALYNNTSKWFSRAILWYTLGTYSVCDALYDELLLDSEAHSNCVEHYFAEFKSVYKIYDVVIHFGLRSSFKVDLSQTGYRDRTP